jgi:hypothetical protein
MDLTCYLNTDVLINIVIAVSEGAHYQAWNAAWIIVAYTR